MKAKAKLKGSKAKKRGAAIDELIEIMARLRSPTGCPWDREQTHMTLRFHAVEEVYELMDAIEAGDDHEMVEELGDLLLQVVFHCQLARERGAYDFEAVAKNISDKLIRRHPHVFGDSNAKTVDEVWAQWDQIKKKEKAGTKHARPSVFDGIPKHLPALLRAEKLAKKAKRAKIPFKLKPRSRLTRSQVGQELLELALYAQDRGWSPEELLRERTAAQEREWRKREVNSE